MALRDTIDAGSQRRTWAAILHKMGIKSPQGPRQATPSNATGTTAGRQIMIFRCDGAPTSNNTSYAPTGLGDLCWDYTNEDVYRCSAFTSTSAFTWTKIVD